MMHNVTIKFMNGSQITFHDMPGEPSYHSLALALAQASTYHSGNHSHKTIDRMRLQEASDAHRS